MNRQMSVSPAKPRNVEAPPYSTLSINSLLSNSNRSTVIWQAMNLTSASRHSSRNSVSEATPCFLSYCFILMVAMLSIPGSIAIKHPYLDTCAPAAAAVTAAGRTRWSTAARREDVSVSDISPFY